MHLLLCIYMSRNIKTLHEWNARRNLTITSIHTDDFVLTNEESSRLANPIGYTVAGKRDTLWRRFNMQSIYMCTQHDT